MEIRPFKGWRYTAGRGGDVSSLIAPPYDVLTAQDKQALLAGGDKNIVAVDLPHVPPKEVGPEDAYRRAAALLGQWMRDGVLVQDTRPAIYAYEQTFAWAGRTYSRRAMLAGLRATPLGQDIIPHEHTFAGPKADRLKLTEYTRVQLSPIFGFFDDAGGAMDALYAAADRPADLQGQLQGVRERLWAVSDEKVIANVAATLKNVPAFIADGHHRYTTAMNYRDALKAAGRIDDNHEANFVLFALVPRSDAGLLILPTHRMVQGLSGEFSVAALASGAPRFAWQRYEGDLAGLADADAFLGRFGRGAMAFIGEGLREVWIGRLADPAAMAAAAPDQSPAWRELDVAILHKLIVDKALAGWKTGDFAIDYTPRGQDVVDACRGGRCRLGICLQSTPLAAVEAIATTGGAMPHKSTYFYPKLATGMVLKPLE